MKKFTIQVTQDDIDNGQRHSCGGCPIALALLRQLPADSYDRGAFEVGGLCVYLDSGVTGIKLPEKVTQFIRNFDDGEIVDPFSFEIEIP